MTPTSEAPVAPTEEQVLPAATESEVPAGSDTQAAAAAPTEDPQVKKLRDRLAEQGRKNAEALQLARQQSQQIAALTGQLNQIGQYLTSQQQAAQKAQLASMEPEQQIAYLSDQLFKMQTQPPRPVPAPVQEAAPSIDPRVAAAVEEINAEFGLDANPITADEVGWHPNEDAWRRVARAIAREKKESEVPAKKVENNKAPETPDIAELVRREVAKATGVGRPNAATPTGVANSGMTIEGLNKMAADNSMSPRARAEAMRKLQG